MDYIAVAKNLISIDTSVPPGANYERAIDYLVPLFKSSGFDTLKIAIPPENAENRDGRFALVCHRRNIGKPRLIFYAHVDVVPAEGWDAFNPKVESGKIYGRGAADMKGGLVGLLLALNEIKDKELGYDVSVMVTVDEEFSQASQLRFLKQFLEPVSGAYVFSIDSSFGFVSIANLGLLQVNILVKGKSVHSGLSHLGDNAIENAVPLLQALLALKKEVVKRKSKVKADPTTGLKYMESRLNINVIKGGLKSNIIPDSCLISVDRRLIPEEDIIEAETELLNCLNKVAGVKWEINGVFRIPTVAPGHGEIIKKLSTVIEKVTGKTGEYGEMGSCDLSAIINPEWGGTELGMGVIRTECNIHGKDEYAYLKDIEDLSRIIREFLGK